MKKNVKLYHMKQKKKKNYITIIIYKKNIKKKIIKIKHKKEARQDPHLERAPLILKTS